MFLLTTSSFGELAETCALRWPNDKAIDRSRQSFRLRHGSFPTVATAGPPLLGNSQIMSTLAGEVAGCTTCLCEVSACADDARMHTSALELVRIPVALPSLQTAARGCGPPLLASSHCDSVRVNSFTEAARYATSSPSVPSNVTCDVVADASWVVELRSVLTVGGETNYRVYIT